MSRPVQVMLDLDERRRARRRAAEQGFTLSEHIARLVRADLDSWAPEADTPASIPIAESVADVPDHEGTYIGEAVAARLNKSHPTGQ
jgi:hypothetical protein